MTSKIARFASDFAPNLSIFSKITRFGCGSPTKIDRIFRLAPQNTNKDAKKNIINQAVLE